MDYYKKGDNYLVSKVTATKDLKKSINKAVKMIGGFKKITKKNETILIKPNYNSDDHFPASSDPRFVKSVIELLLENGAGDVEIGESSGPYWKPTMSVLKHTGLLAVAKELGVKVHSFDREKWEQVNIKGKNMDNVNVAKSVLDADKLVYLPCLKTHTSSRFTLSLKLSMGLIKNMDRYKMHLHNLEEKIGDINLAVNPSLIIMDGRKCFVTGGPACGRIENPNMILASGNRVSIDIEGIKILQSYNANNQLDRSPWKLPQIKSAILQGLGPKSSKEYKILK